VATMEASDEMEMCDVNQATVCGIQAPVAAFFHLASVPMIAQRAATHVGTFKRGEPWRRRGLATRQ
jgi:hypothetical protein